jgi:hypothetical protein
MNHEHLCYMTEQALMKFLPAAIAKPLASAGWMRGFYARTLSWRCHTPGKFYSFLAIRPAR